MDKIKKIINLMLGFYKNLLISFINKDKKLIRINS